MVKTTARIDRLTINFSGDPRMHVVLAAEDEVVEGRVSTSLTGRSQDDVQVSSGRYLEDDCFGVAVQAYQVVSERGRVRCRHLFCSARHDSSSCENCVALGEKLFDFEPTFEAKQVILGFNGDVISRQDDRGASNELRFQRLVVDVQIDNVRNIDRAA